MSQRKTRYFDPATGMWTDHCPWQGKAMPDGARISVDTMLMDAAAKVLHDNGYGGPPTTTPKPLTDAQKRAERQQAWQDHYTQQREANLAAIAADPRASAYHKMCDELQRGAA